MNHHIYQIYYSPETRELVDPGFIPLDNTGQRPDWYEYWPIRRFLLENTLDENALYGFLSPKFGAKTGLTSTQVAEFLDSTPADVDVVTFSPYFSNSAFFTNVFEQAEYWHPGISAALAGVMKLIAPHRDSDAVMSGLVMSSASTVYCNYFAAKPRFWRYWLTLCERIFEVAEAGDTELGQALNSDRRYMLPTNAKVFVIERIPSIILSSEPGNWKVRNYDSTLLHAENGLLGGKYRDELIVLDALKYAASVTGARAYFDRFMETRAQLANRYLTESGKLSEPVATADGETLPDNESAAHPPPAQTDAREEPQTQELPPATDHDAAPMNRHVWQEYLDFESTSARQSYHATGRPDLAQMYTNTPSLILDIGCAAGSNTELIKARFPGSRAWGIEMNRDAADMARKKLDRVLVGKFEDFDLQKEGIAHGTLDAVLLADVLEHMYNPWDVLVKLRPYMAPTGQLVLSIPNTRNLSLLNHLATGNWSYAGAGLLDITHIRFFTLKEMLKMCTETGYRVVTINGSPDGGLTPYWELIQKNSGPFTIDIELGRLTFKKVTRDELIELCSLQFYLLLEKDAAQGAV